MNEIIGQYKQTQMAYYVDDAEMIDLENGSANNTVKVAKVSENSVKKKKKSD